MFAQRFDCLFSVIRNKEGRTVILKRQNAEIALDDVDALAEKYYKDKKREIIVQTDLPESEVQPLVSKLESHGFSVRVKPQISFP